MSSEAATNDSAVFARSTSFGSMGATDPAAGTIIGNVTAFQSGSGGYEYGIGYAGGSFG